MTSVEMVRIESDECGFELHLWVDEDLEVDNRGRVVLNIHSVAHELLREVDQTIRPWWAEGEAVAREMLAARDSDDEQWLGESALDYYQRTGNDEPLREMADIARARAKEAGL